MLQTERKEEYEDPPGQRPPQQWEDLSGERGNNCRRQWSCHLNTVEELARVIHLTPEEVGGLLVPGLFRVRVTGHPAQFSRVDHAGQRAGMMEGGR